MVGNFFVCLPAIAGLQALCRQGCDGVLLQNLEGGEAAAYAEFVRHLLLIASGRCIPTNGLKLEFDTILYSENTTKKIKSIPSRYSSSKSFI